MKIILVAAARPKNVFARVSRSCEPEARQPQATKQSKGSTPLTDRLPWCHLPVTETN